MRPWFRLRRQVRLHLRGKGLSARQAKPVAQLQAVDELLFDPAHTIDSLAVRDGKSERSIRMTLSLAFVSPVLAEAAMEGRLPRGFCVKRLNRPADAMVRAMARPGTAGANSAAGRTQLIDATAKGKGTSGGPARLKVPMGQAGADRPIVVMKRGNARGAKGVGHSRHSLGWSPLNEP